MVRREQHSHRISHVQNVLRPHGKSGNEQKRTLFHNLRSISERYTVALGLLGGCLSFLYKSCKACEDTIDLTRTFLIEIAIFDSTLSGGVCPQTRVH